MLASSEALRKVALLPCASLPDPLHSRYSCNHMWPSSLAQTPINSWSPLTLMPRGSCYRHPISLMEPKAGRLPTATAPRGQEGPPRENVSLAETRTRDELHSTTRVDGRSTRSPSVPPPPSCEWTHRVGGKAPRSRLPLSTSSSLLFLHQGNPGEPS